jgi:hypothetical protein
MDAEISWPPVRRFPSSAGKFVIATVKGDVHDIGKNISAWSFPATIRGDRPWRDRNP